MALTLYTSPDCLSCKIVKAFMVERALSYEEVDIKGEGRTEFTRFYREHQPEIQRTAEGIAFPICYDGSKVRQGPGVILAWLLAGSALDGFVRQSSRGQGWIDGFDLSGGDPADGEELTIVLRYLKQQGVKIAVETDGRNSELFERLLDQKLVDEAVFTLRGPAGVYADLADRPAGPDMIRRSLQLLMQAPVQRIMLPVDRVRRADGSHSDLTPDEAAAAAALAAEATGNNRTPLLIRPLCEAASGAAAFKYRAAVRRHMPSAEIIKP
jgi:glutaredoxin